jgi:transcriptional regulator with XRE-family HTH domain
MDFFDRYKQLCTAQDILPNSQRAADMFGVTRATITSWGKNKNTPKGDTLVRIADAFGVSVDYLLGRVDDPVDYENPALQAELAGEALEALGGDIKKAAAFQQAVAEDVRREKATQQAGTPRILTLWAQLDLMDQVRVEAYIEGMLAADKYRVQQMKKMG